MRYNSHGRADKAGRLSLSGPPWDTSPVGLSAGPSANDVGPLAEGRRCQRDTAAYVQPYFGPSGDRMGPGGGVTTEQLKETLAAAVRYRDK